MKPVYQTIIDPVKGNCTSAAIASILELPLEDVPNFAANNPDSATGFYDDMDRWLSDNDVIRLRIDLSGIDHNHLFWSVPYPHKWCLVSGPSTTFDSINHCVVGKCRMYGIDLIHDPNPSNKFFDGKKPVAITFLIPAISHKGLRELREKEWMLDDLNQ